MLCVNAKRFSPATTWFRALGITTSGREFTRAEVREVAGLCRSCHAQVHRFLTVKDLERDFHTVEKLRAHPGVAAFAEWIRRKPGGFRAAMRNPRVARRRVSRWAQQSILAMRALDHHIHFVMKTLHRSLLFSILALASATSLVTASVPTMEVKVVSAAGKMVFNGKTDGRGLFATKPLAPGDYVVQFNSDSSKGGPFAVVVSAGKKKVVADSVPAAKFVKGGIAMKLKVDKAMSVTGQVAAEGQLAADSGTAEKADGRKVKYINGKKYVWVQSEIGSNLGGHWVDASSPEGRNVETLSNQAISEIQQSRSRTPGGN